MRHIQPSGKQTMRYPDGTVEIGEYPTLEWFEKMKEHIDFEKAVVLDLGCNDGMMSILAREAGAVICTGVDKDGERISTAKELSTQYGYMNEFFWKKIEEFKFPKRYHVTIASMVLHELEYPVPQLDRIRPITSHYFVVIYRKASRSYDKTDGSWFPTEDQMDYVMSGFDRIHSEVLLTEDEDRDIVLGIYERQQ